MVSEGLSHSRSSPINLVRIAWWWVCMEEGSCLLHRLLKSAWKGECLVVFLFIHFYFIIISQPPRWCNGVKTFMVGLSLLSWTGPEACHRHIQRCILPISEVILYLANWTVAMNHHTVVHKEYNRDFSKEIKQRNIWSSWQQVSLFPGDTLFVRKEGMTKIHEG